MEGSALAVFEVDAHQTRAAFERRSHFFNDDPSTPVFVPEVENLIAEPQKQSLLDRHLCNLVS